MPQQQQDQGLAMHETLEIHEILSFKTVGLTKSKLMQSLVTDDELKTLFKKDIQQSTQAIEDLQNLISEEQ